ncbi:inorganic phosphate transporter [Stenotrophobium rhamnosiphilum]|uniref:Anion permease n=1 Tax=Stenotrophobium rhamnosiphilum TaxID=2029166 RepID=A0A2T5MHW1_9GAMM|nr:inorganic phosphate transporter [Stenotrophobium rhamnosiphilum]PTU32119.1 anion permease [Stenotrophobium rhamnosiphilum]
MDASIIGLHTVIFLVVLALLFDFMNGFHDSANSIATIVSTGAMSPQKAVVWAAFFNFIAFIFFGFHVATTIGKGTIDPSIVDHHVIFGALVGAISWNIITWYYGIPSSSSHALVGGLAGAAIAKGGTGTLIAAGFLKTAAAILLSPLFGFLLGALLMVMASWVGTLSTARKMDRFYKYLQYVSAALYSLGHGSNDAQKTMGIIWMILIASQITTADAPLPFWVVLACQTAMGLGTLFGGWRIVRTMGMKITKLRPVSGFSASASGAITLFIATSLGVPVSTTHTITGSIVGVGAARNVNAVRWGVAGNIVWAWVLTIPSSAFIAGVAWWVGQHYF